jgi:hypothetical protein
MYNNYLEGEMVTTLFSDEIVNPTDLRKNQKRWLDMAAKSPVSIAYGKYNLALLNREHIADIYKANHYLVLAMKLCTGISCNEKISEFPWIEHLDSTERLDFALDFTQNISSSMITGDWEKVENVFSDWKATAETLSNKEAREALKPTDHSKVNYTDLK